EGRPDGVLDRGAGGAGLVAGLEAHGQPRVAEVGAGGGGLVGARALLGRRRGEHHPLRDGEGVPHGRPAEGRRTGADEVVLVVVHPRHRGRVHLERARVVGRLRAARVRLGAAGAEGGGAEGGEERGAGEGARERDLSHGNYWLTALRTATRRSVMRVRSRT